MRIVSRMLSIGLAAAIAAGGPSVGLGQGENQESARGVIEEVVVTARKREESLQTVPIAVTAFGTADFERLAATNFKDLNLSIPNVTIVNNNVTSNAAQVYIRGIGRDNSTWNEESGVAIYVDGVYYSQQVGSLVDFVDLERVEVLRGPQGTLYGRNATGGAVKFIVRRPEFAPLSIVGDVTLGSFHRLDVRGSVGGEVIDDKLAVKVDFVSRTDDGPIRRPADSAIKPNERLNGINRQTARVAALYNVSDRTEIYLTGDVSFGRSDLNTGTAMWDPDGDGKPTPVYGNKFVTDPSVPNDTRFTGYTLKGEVNTKFGGVDFKSISAFRSIDDEIEGDIDGSAFLFVDLNQRLKFETFTQEFQFVGQLGARLDYVVGLFYLDEELFANALNVFLGNVRTLSSQDTTSMAAYLDLTYKLSDRWSVSAGGRYTRDKKKVSQSAIREPMDVAIFEDANNSKSWSEVSPRVALDFNATPEMLIYASYSEGFKAGAVVNGRPTSALVATLFTEPETVDTMEVGVKSQWLDDRLRVNMAAFSSDYQNLQSSFQQPGGGVISLVTADVELKGVDFEAVASIVDPLSVYVTAGWLDSKYRNVQPGHPAFGKTDTIKMKMVPETSFKIGVEYRTALPWGASDFIFDVNYLDVSKIPLNLVNTPFATVPAHGTLGAQIAVASQDSRWRVALSGENLSGEEYWTMAQPPFTRYFVPERTWALTMRYAVR